MFDVVEERMTLPELLPKLATQTVVLSREDRVDAEEEDIPICPAVTREDLPTSFTFVHGRLGLLALGTPDAHVTRCGSPIHVRFGVPRRKTETDGATTNSARFSPG